MEQIINEQSLLEDTIEALCEHGFTKEKAILICTNDFMEDLVNSMFEAQSEFISNSIKKIESNYNKFKQQNFHIFPSKNGDAVVYYCLEPEDLVVGNFISSPRFGVGRITKIIDNVWFEADMFSGSGCCGSNLMQFMHDGKSHWNDTVPSVFKHKKGLVYVV